MIKEGFILGSDYTDTQGGISCPNCNKDFEVGRMGGFVPCECEQERLARMDAGIREKERLSIAGDLRKIAHDSPLYATYTFANDNGKFPEITSECKLYVANWTENLALNRGRLFEGSAGIGKTFAACMCANGIIDKYLASVWVITFRNLIRYIESSGLGAKRNEIYDRIKNVDLLVLDDLGIERESPYKAEVIHGIIDERYASLKPLIVTTNLDAIDFKSEDNLSYQRIYDRIIQYCLPVSMEGKSQRKEYAKQWYIEHYGLE
jgi:DNA replication protein DnaC